MGNVGYAEFKSQKGKKLKKAGNAFLSSALATLVILFIAFGLIYAGLYAYSKHISIFAKFAPIYSVHIDSPINIYRQNEFRWIETGGNFQLNVNDTLTTGNNPRTVLSYKDSCSLRVAPQSIFKYSGNENDTLMVGIEQGRLWLESWEGKYSIETSRGKIDLKQGTVQVRADQKNTVRIFCYLGPVTITTTALKNNKVILKSGQKVRITDNNEISPASKILAKNNNEWDTWNLSFSGKGIKVGQVLPIYIYRYESSNEKVGVAVNEPSNTSRSQNQSMNWEPVRQSTRQIASKNNSSKRKSGKTTFSNEDVPEYRGSTSSGNDKSKNMKAYSVEKESFNNPKMKGDKKVSAPPFSGSAGSSDKDSQSGARRTGTGVYGHTGAALRNRSATERLNNENYVTTEPYRDATHILHNDRYTEEIENYYDSGGSGTQGTSPRGGGGTPAPRTSSDSSSSGCAPSGGS